MAMPLGALRDALLEAGASPEKAGRAAEKIATYDRELADIRSDLKLLKWITGATFAGVVTIMVRIFTH
jgi:hypothetical protein